jgi:hypothetical protein
VSAQSAHVRKSDAHHPRLRVWLSLVETVCRFHLVGVHLPRPSFYIDENEFAFILFGFYKRPDVTIVNLIAPSGEFFFWVSRLFDSHVRLLSGW